VTVSATSLSCGRVGKYAYAIKIENYKYLLFNMDFVFAKIACNIYIVVYLIIYLLMESVVC